MESLEKKETKVVKTAPKKKKLSDSKILISSNTKKARPKKKKSSFKQRGVIYIGHIPHGFYEDEMKSYFNQFGPVVATTVARSKKTGRSKGYGFVEFTNEEVAKIAAETMNNYLMFNRIIKCRYIPPEERQHRIFVRTIRPTNCSRQENRLNNERNKVKALSSLTQKTYLEKAQKKISEFKKFFEERGIDFQFQLNNKNIEVNNSSKTNTKLESESETEDDTDDQFGILEIDESDSEISFKTPPQVKKVIKRSFGFSETPSKEFGVSQTKIMNSLKKSFSSKTQLKNKRNLKRKLKSQDDNEKLKGKKTNTEKLKKCLKTKKSKPLKKENSSAVKQKHLRVKKNIGVKAAKKKKPLKQELQIYNSKLNKTIKNKTNK